ncbi:signal peptidase I [Boudabousia tangfeifanii]|uniref:Signal peptidase I n=1 Tax=Boudabousia tangfeifanii TaxID=1912795 RepID=A0A1D9MK33_9ACTO|nr:signal peptidase I [Boudabousia tangfeifanii]AOZ72543.1 signal peptidase I [Boudabousia tangfeifanii]
MSTLEFFPDNLPDPEPRNRPAHLRSKNEERSVGGQVFDFLLILVLVLVTIAGVRHFVAQRFYIPTGSMEQTIMPEDYVLASRLTPNTVPVRRGDIVVFHDSGHWLGEANSDKVPVWEKGLVWLGLKGDRSSQQLIKRVIGLPGDRVSCCSPEGRLVVNGIAVKEPYLAPGTLPSEEPFDVRVPEGRIWVMGDNRQNSADSRAHMDLDGKGSVPLSDVLGRAVAITWPISRMSFLEDYSEVFSQVPNAK